MQQFKKISSLFFLSIFSTLMLHQALPHSHHQHELIDVVEASEHHHSHAHSHDHDKEENKDSNDHSGFLDFLLGSHAHTYHSNDFEVRNIAKQQIKVKEFSAFTLPLFHTFLFKKESEPDRIIVYQPPGNFDFNLSTPSLRGPPILG